MRLQQINREKKRECRLSKMEERRRIGNFYFFFLVAVGGVLRLSELISVSGADREN